MRITSSHRDHTTNLAKCTKMTEGEHRIHGMNGVSDSGNAAVKVQEESTQSATAAPDTYNNLGGRLKFFKNGRFILELARAREGEKVAWVPVPKKTFWPPQGSASALSTYRQESSTSLSVSDDNSSVQSSPWQRDHTWKQTSPQRNVSTNLSFYFVNNKRSNKNQQRVLLGQTCWQYKLQRAPYLKITEQQRTKCITFNNSGGSKCNNSKCVNSNNSSSAIPSRKSRQTLVNVVQFLWNKSLQALNSITSPRKRILRELERVTIDDLSIYNKRCRGKVNQQSKPPVTIINHSQQQQPPCITTNNNNNNDNTNISLVNKYSVQNNSTNNSRSDVNGSSTGGTFDDHQPRVVTTSSIIIPCSSVTSAKNCSYSITSLLGGIIDTNRDGNKIEKLSSSHYTTKISTTPTDNNSQILTSSPTNNHQGHLYASADTVDGLSSKNTSENMKNNKRSPISRGRSPPSSVPSTAPSPSTHYNYSPVTSAHQHHSQPQTPPSHYMSPYSIYSSVLHHHHPAAAAAAASYMNPYYHHQSPAAAAAYVAVRSGPPPGFYHPLVQQQQSAVHQPLAARHEPQYSPPWTNYEQHQASTALHRDDSDVPLNLSKHAD